MLITLINGTQLESDTLTFDPDTYHFTVNGINITDDIRRVDKVALIPDFDVEKENARLFNEKRGGTGPAAPLDDSTSSILGHQLATDPLGAPLAALDKGVSQLVNSKGLQVTLIAGVVILVAFLFIEKKV